MNVDANANEPVTAVAPRPVVVISRCLGFEPVRYDGEIHRDAWVERLAPRVRFIDVCPEIGIGMGVPRPPIRIELRSGRRRLIQPSTGADLTARMEAFAASFLDRVGPVDGFILKSRSPSCGLIDTKLFDEGAMEPRPELGAGFFAAAVLARFPHAAIIDEVRLAEPAARDAFLERTFAAWRARTGRDAGCPTP